ncbi:MAG: FAD-binding protein [Bacteroidota bacterium]|nr:FAD-binding protein [Bacteroidota bacterium]
MNRLQNDFPLKKYNSFGFDVNAKLYFSFSDEKQIIDFLPIIREKNYPILVLGGGSNILFTQDFSGIVIHPLNKGIKIIAEKADDILIKVSAGETWDDFVAWAVDHNYYGVENLSHIPGNVGATPIQNIGAYGVELANSLEKLKAIEINTGKEKYFTNKECDFGYRSSIFKHQLKGQYIITEVFF